MGPSFLPTPLGTRQYLPPGFDVLAYNVGSLIHAILGRDTLVFPPVAIAQDCALDTHQGISSGAPLWRTLAVSTRNEAPSVFYVVFSGGVVDLYVVVPRNRATGLRLALLDARVPLEYPLQRLV